MVRAIAGVIVGYIVMFIVVFVTFTVAYLVMGTDGAFKPGSWEASTLWVTTAFVLSFIAALLGGLVCAIVARPRSKAPMVLAGLVLVLGLALAVPKLTKDEGEAPPRGDEVDNIEAMNNAREPAYSALLTPLIGAVGVLIGGQLRGGGKPD